MKALRRVSWTLPFALALAAAAAAQTLGEPAAAAADPTAPVARELAKALFCGVLAFGSLACFAAVAGRPDESAQLRRGVVGITAFKACACLALYLLLPASSFASDAARYYLPETLRFLGGEMPYRDFRSGYSPLFHLFLMPGVLLWPAPGSVVATLFASEVALVVLYARRFARAQPTRTWRVLFLYCFSPISFYWVALTGYNSVLIALFALIALLLADARRDAAAGAVAVVGLACSKLTMVLAWPAIALYARRGLVGRVAPMAVLVALLPLLVAVRVDILRDALHGRFLATSGNIWYLLSILFAVSPETRLLKLASMLCLLGALGALLAVFLSRTRLPESGSFDRAGALFSGCGLLFMLLAYKTYPWYLTMCLVFVLHTLVASGRTSTGALLPFALLGALTTLEPGLSIGLRMLLGPLLRPLLVPIDLVVIGCLAWYAVLCIRVAVAPAEAAGQPALAAAAARLPSRSATL